MNAKDIFELISELQTTSGTNDKKDILKVITIKKDDLLIKYLNYVYDEVNYVYGKSKLPDIPVTSFPLDDFDNELEEMFALLDDMNNGILKGNSSDAAMTDYCILKPSFYQDLLFYAIKRDLKAKVSAKTINEVFGRIIPIAPYMRCEQESYMSKRIKYSSINEHGQIDNHGALAQSKADGAFLNTNLLKDYDEVECTTRYGRNVPTNTFQNSLSVIPTLLGWNENKVLHGELLLKDKDGNIMSRETGNGKINKYAKRNTTLIELDKKVANAKSDKSRLKAEDIRDEHIKEWTYISENLVYEVWDIVPENDWLDLKYSKSTIERFNEVIQIVKLYNDYVNSIDYDLKNCELRLIDYEIVYNDIQAMNFYQRQLDDGLEGMVIKNLAAPWCHDTNREGIIKLKDFKENDLIIVGYNMADPDSDFVGGIGSLICESSDGLIKVSVSGMKRDQRGLERVDKDDSSKGLQVIEDFDFDQFTGKIMAVKYNEMTKDKDTGVFSLFLPNVLEIRDRSDKTQADDFKKIKKTAKYKG